MGKTKDRYIIYIDKIFRISEVKTIEIICMEPRHFGRMLTTEVSRKLIDHPNFTLTKALRDMLIINYEMAFDIIKSKYDNKN